MIPVRGGPWCNRVIPRREDRFEVPGSVGYYSLLCGVYLWVTKP